MEFDTLAIWHWLIPVLTGALCGIIGYYTGKAGGTPDPSPEMASMIERNTQLEAELRACRQKIADRGATPSGVITFDARAAQAAFGRLVKQDDLKIIEGIGPKIQGLFHNFDIKTWQALSETSVLKCREVLESGGERYRVHDPASWPMQAKMCIRGKWKELHKWQEEHKRGKL